jgi:hypothetical protein
MGEDAMREMLIKLVKQLKVELNKDYTPREYNPNRNTLGVPKTPRQFRKSNTGALADSIDYDVKEVGGELVGLITMADYYWYVDRGRKPGGKERTPYDENTGKGDSIKTTGYSSGFRKAIDNWVRQRIGTFPGLTFESTSFLVRRSIWRKGIGGINFINNAIDNIIDEAIKEGQDDFAEQFEEFIDEKLLVLSKSSSEITYNT